MPLGEGQRLGQEFVSQYSFPIEHKDTERVSNVAVSSAGQDIHKPGMFNEIVNHPSGLEVIRRANAILDPEFEFRITRKVDETPDHEVFKKTQFIQPRVFVASIAAHNINKYDRHKNGYRTLPRYMTGNSMGMVTAATLAGALSFEEGLRVIATRGKIMQEFGEATPTGMVSTVNASEQQVRALLKKYPDLDMCLINSETGFVYGGPLESLGRMTEDLKAQKVKVLPVNADRAMHSRYTHPARNYWDDYLSRIRFNTPLIPLVGTLKGQPIHTPDEIIEELAYGFDNTFDNAKIMEFFDSVGIHVFSELNEKGIFAKALERTAGAIASHKTETGAIIGTGAAVGFGLYEVLTRHHPRHPGKK